MKKSETTIENLQTKIKKAFSDVQPLEVENIVTHNCPKCRAIRRVFKNENWQDLKAKKIDWAYDKLPLFTPKAFRYFLPAFLLYSLRKPESDVCQFVFYNLTEKEEENESLQKWWLDRLNEFTKVQKEVCVSFLRWLQSQPENDWLNSKNKQEIERALEIWWETKAS